MTRLKKQIQAENDVCKESHDLARHFSKGFCQDRFFKKEKFDRFRWISSKTSHQRRAGSISKHIQTHRILGPDLAAAHYSPPLNSSSRYSGTLHKTTDQMCSKIRFIGHVRGIIKQEMHEEDCVEHDCVIVYSNIQAIPIHGNWIDIFFHFAAIELVDLAGVVHNSGRH